MLTIQRCGAGYSAMRPNWSSGPRRYLKPTNKSWRVDETYIRQPCRGWRVDGSNGDVE
jgi:transposase-like protein